MNLIAMRDYARNLLGRMASSGWRPYFGWGLGTLLLLASKFALMDAPRAGIELDGGYYTFLLGLFGIFMGAFITREVGKHLERGPRVEPAPGGGLVNPAALS